MKPSCKTRGIWSGLVLAGLLAGLVAAWPAPVLSQQQIPAPPTPQEPQDLKKGKGLSPKAPQPAPMMDKPKAAPRLRSMTPEARPSSTRRMGGMEIRAKEGEEKE